MKNKKLLYSENIICPFCNTLLVSNVEDNKDYEICIHTIFIATDYGFEFIREDYKNIIDMNMRDNYDNYTRNLHVKGIRLAQYNPPPSFFGVYWGFVEN